MQNSPNAILQASTTGSAILEAWSTLEDMQGPIGDYDFRRSDPVSDQVIETRDSIYGMVFSRRF